MDASIYCWGPTLCQYISELNNLDDLTPITFISGNLLCTYYNYVELVRVVMPSIYQPIDLASNFKMLNVQYSFTINHYKNS